ITEITELSAKDGVHGVAHAANGVPFLVIKAAASAEDDVEKAEADEIEAELTKAWEQLDKALSAADREKMPASSFAFVDKKGGKHLPIHDKGHATAAQGRVSQQDFSEAKGDPAKAKETAEGKIKAAVDKFGNASKGEI